MSEAAASFECEDCGNRVEDVPMRIAKCVECGGDMVLAESVPTELVDLDDVMVGDWIVSEYDLDGRPSLVVRVEPDHGDRGRVWIVDPRTETSGSPSPSYVNPNGIRAHVPRGEAVPGPIEAESEGVEAPTTRPTPPELPKYLREGAEKQGPGDLRALARYAEQLAAWKEAEADRELDEQAERELDDAPDEWDDDEWDEVVDDAREKADLGGKKGTLTTKHIDGRDYFYLQWREGDTIKSQYVAPVTPADS